MSSKYIKWIQVLSILLALLSMGQLMFTATLLFLISIILSKSGGYVATICGLIASLVCLPTAFKIRTHYGNKDEQKIRHYDIQTYHRCMLYISLGVQTFCALVCFACLTQNETTEVALTSAITKYQQKFSDKKFLDIVQVLFQCCGIYSYEDWAQKTWISATKQQIFCKHEFNDETFKNVETSPTAELNAKFLTAVPYSCCKIETSKPCRNFDLKCSGVKTINTNGCITELNTFITSIICSELIIYLFSIAVVVAMLKFFNWEETEIYLSDGDDYSKLEGDDIEKAADLKSSDIKSPKKRVHEEYIHRTTTSREPKSKIEEKITSPKILSPPTQKPSVIETTTESKSRSNSSIPDTKSKESLPSDREDKKLPEDGTRKSIKPVAEPSKTNISARKSIKPTSEPSIPKKSVKPAEDLLKTGTSSRKSIKPPTDTKPEFSSHKSIKTHAESPKASASPRKSMKPHVESSKTNNTARKSMKPPEDPSKTSASPRKSMKPHAPPSKTDTKKSMKPLEDLSKTSASPRKSIKPHAAPYKTDTKKSMKPPEDSSKTSASPRKSMKPHTENKDLRGGSNKLDKPLKHKRSRAGLSLLRRKKKKKKEEATPVASPTSSIDPSPAPSPVPSPAPSLVPSQIVVPAQTPPTSVSVTPSDSSAMTITPTDLHRIESNLLMR